MKNLSAPRPAAARHIRPAGLLVASLVFPLLAFPQTPKARSADRLGWIFTPPAAAAQAGLAAEPQDLSFNAPSPSPDDKGDDPGGKLYKEGYELILNEKWNEAQKRLEELVSRYPKSRYLDDARYWIAYALKQTHPDKARAAYEKFIKEYPKSKYVDDAVADLSELEAGPVTVFVTSGDESSAVFKKFPHGFAYGVGSSMRVAREEVARSNRQMQRLSRQLEHLGRPLAPLALPSKLRLPGLPGEDESLDQETKLKMKALYALGETREDEKAFTALRDVALNMREARPLREAALDALSEFKKFDILPVYIDIARRDTSEDLQNYAIDYISQHGKDKAKTVQTLIDLFKALPKGRSEQKREIFYSIAELGGDRSVDFLASIAKSSDDYDLRGEAIYYLGSIGGEKARGALYDIIRGQKER